MASLMRAIRSALRPAACHPQLVPALGVCQPAATSSSADAAGGFGLDSIAERLTELLAPLWLAVPKSKTTRSRKRMRAANKHLKNINHINKCHVCGTPKLRHHVCLKCMTADWNDPSVVDHK